ncbi:hypothetical protein BGZ76_004858 [Entomortierella beljakovae]|nr:hypothetical protein BGZ76_004858 [Entomortierella beljakovae]
MSDSTSLLFSDSTSSSYRPGFWSNFKAQLPLWTSSSAEKTCQLNNAKGNRYSATRDFAPPVALLLSNSSPIVTLNSTLVVSSTEDVLLSLSNADTLDGIDTNSISLTSGFYSASVAAVDKLKVMRTDNIPLKTFTYHETDLKEQKQKRSNSLPAVKQAIPRPSPQVLSSNCSTPTPEKKHEELPVPRHLACREMRSNSDYLRMMASEMNMIRSRKLIAPLKPRGYLARRKDLFCNVKSSLCVSIDIPCEEEDDDNLVVGSWSSVSSTGSYLSATSADYTTADEENFE